MDNIPNILTVSRVLLTPVFALCFFAERPAGFFAALIVAAVAQVTDGLDGYLARRRGLVSDFGKIADPLADCVFNLTAFACFASEDLIPVWMLALLIARELFMHAFLRPAASRYGVAMGARLGGKIKTAVQCAVLDASLFLLGMSGTLHPAEWRGVFLPAMGLVVILSIGSLYGYLTAFLRLRRQAADTSRIP